MSEEIVFKNKNNKEIYELLSEFVDIRKLANDTDDKVINKRYQKSFEKVVKKFSYIPGVHARKYMKYSNYSDLVQEGMVGLVMAINNFDMDRSRCFLKVANWYVKTKIKRAANKFELISVPICKKEKALQRTDFKNNFSLYYEDNSLESKDNVKFIKETIYALPVQSKKIFCYFYGFDFVDDDVVFFNKKTAEQISKELDVSLSTIRTTITKINKKIII